MGVGKVVASALGTLAVAAENVVVPDLWQRGELDAVGDAAFILWNVGRAGAVNHEQIGRAAAADRVVQDCSAIRSLCTELGVANDLHIDW